MVLDDREQAPNLPDGLGLSASGWDAWIRLDDGVAVRGSLSDKDIIREVREEFGVENEKSEDELEPETFWQLLRNYRILWISTGF